MLSGGGPIASYPPNFVILSGAERLSKDAKAVDFAKYRRRRSTA